jgi:hypothetical protein
MTTLSTVQPARFVTRISYSTGVPAVASLGAIFSTRSTALFGLQLG